MTDSPNDVHHRRNHPSQGLARTSQGNWQLHDLAEEELEQTTGLRFLPGEELLALPGIRGQCLQVLVRLHTFTCAPSIHEINDVDEGAFEYLDTFQ